MYIKLSEEEYKERKEFGINILRKMGLYQGLNQHIEDKQYRPYFEAIMTTLYPNEGNTEENICLSLWRTFRHTAAKELVLRKVFRSQGTKWCYANLELDEEEKILLMATILGSHEEG